MTIIVIVIIVLLCAVAAVIGWVIGSGAARNALEIETQERNAAQARERDRALSVIDALNAQREHEAEEARATISDLRVQLVERTERYDRMDIQWRDAQQTIKAQNATIAELRAPAAPVALDVAAGQSQEVVYEVKTPKRPRKTVAKASNAAGNDGTQ
ncbi:MAG TPA: hypothetical protein VFQ36_24270 [Ktedonobacteraceae bacterium]|nr:hypothetical protein [Ktedonobacteraceae bacterium]